MPVLGGARAFVRSEPQMLVAATARLFYVAVTDARFSSRRFNRTLVPWRTGEGRGHFSFF